MMPTPRQLSVVLKFSTELQLKNKISLVLLVSWMGFILNLCLYGLAVAQSKDTPSFLEKNKNNTSATKPHTDTISTRR